MISGAIVTTLRGPVSQSEDQTFIAGSRHHHQTGFPERHRTGLAHNYILSPSPQKTCRHYNIPEREGEEDDDDDGGAGSIFNSELGGAT